MRTIKFRGKMVNGGEWVYGNLEINSERSYISSPDVLLGDEIILETVGQFTGLHLWSGKDLYEGDIVDVDYIFYDPTGGIDPRFEPSRCIVVYENTAFRFKNVEDRYYFIHEVRNIKIVGNIHDNPELMKGGEE